MAKAQMSRKNRPYVSLDTRWRLDKTTYRFLILTTGLNNPTNSNALENTIPRFSFKLQ